MISFEVRFTNYFFKIDFFKSRFSKDFFQKNFVGLDFQGHITASTLISHFNYRLVMLFALSCRDGYRNCF